MFDVYPNDLIKAAAEELKNIPDVKPPVWAGFVKTGRHKERTPLNPDWWYVRVAAVLRSVYRLGPIGVSKLRTKYGGKRRRGHKMPHSFKGSGSIIRKALQQLEKAGFIKQIDVKGHKGRVLTPKGKSFLDKIALKLSKAKPKPVRVKEQPVELIKKEPKKAEQKAPEEKPKEKPAEKKEEK